MQHRFKLGYVSYIALAHYNMGTAGRIANFRRTLVAKTFFFNVAIH